MAGASITGSSRRAWPPPGRRSGSRSPTLDDNVPAAITEAFVDAYRKAGGHVDRVHFPESRHGFAQQASPATDKCVADVLDFIGRRTGSAQGA